MSFNDENLLLSESEIIVKESFTSHLVVPDVINRLPESKLDISFSNNTIIQLGNLIMPEYVNFLFVK